MRTRLWRDLLGRYAVVQREIRLLDSLRRTVEVPDDADLSESQWSLVESQLQETAARISAGLAKGAREHVAASPSVENARSFNALIGRSELSVSRHFDTFDMLLDVLSQRRMPELGTLLAGCDVLAFDALQRHKRLEIYAQPLVYLDRGFGASIMREGVPLPGGATNAIPLIQIPYSKLAAKHGLTSIVHEVGHQALEGLGLVTALPAAVGKSLAALGASPAIQRTFSLWMKELGPDFWGFCNCGAAQASSIREILSLPPETVFSLVPSDPHPPPYVRVLFSFWWCRKQWGRGYWSTLERDWRRLYPLSAAPGHLRKTLQEFQRYIPGVSRVLFRHRFAQLDGRPIPALFRLERLHPRRLHGIVRRAAARRVLNLSGISPCEQLAAFRQIKDLDMLPDVQLDSLMTRWLNSLALRKQYLTLSGRNSTNG